jgi:hypothetical protein
VIRVRGKNILLISLIAMMLSVVMVGINPTTAAPNATMSIEPAVISGHAGDTFEMSVDIAHATDVWAVQFTVQVNPYVSVLTAHDIQEGDFMNDGGDHATYFTYTVDSFAGTFTVVIFRLGPPPRIGAEGEGTLCTFKLTVVESGESPIDLINAIVLSPAGDPRLVWTRNGYFYGPYANLIRANLPLGRKVKVGANFPIAGKVKNNGDIPLTCRIRYDITRLEDSRTIRIYAGQTYSGGGLGEPLPFEYLYVDEFNEWYYEFNGAATNLFGEPDGNYIEGDANAQWASLYSFEDISLGGKEIADIWVETYSRFPNGFTEAVDIDLYGFSSVSSFAWWGSSWGSTDWGWVGTRWIGGESVLQQQPELADETELNNVEMLVYNYHGDAPDVMQIDSARLKVEFAAITPVTPPEFVVNPGMELELDPVTWLSAEDHLGTYELTATIEYTSEGFKWNSWGSAQKTLFFWIVP